VSNSAVVESARTVSLSGEFLNMGVPIASGGMNAK
jgi:hypothetical protein